MKRLILRYGALGLTLALTGGLLAACGDDDGGSNNVNQNANDNGNQNNNNNVTYGCSEACVDMAAALCDQGPTTAAECEPGCNAALVSCPTELAALLDCASVDPVVTCDASGMVVYTGCETESADIEACMNQPPEVCQTVCPDVVAADCAGGPPTLDDCVNGCEQTVFTCHDEFQAVQDCAGLDPIYACNDIGSPYPQGCTAEDEALMICLWNVPQACVDACPAVVAADCLNGPPGLMECWNGCGTMMANCEAEFTAWIDCGGVDPAFSCDANGQIAITGCETEGGLMYACINGG